MKVQIHSEFENEKLVYNHSTKSEQVQEDYYPHYHDVTELVFVKSGDMWYEVGGKTYDLQRNTLVISRPNERHYINCRSEADYERYNILFDERALPFDLYRRIPGELNVISFDANKSVIGVFDKMDIYCKKLSGEDLGQMLFNLICEVLMNVIIETGQMTEAQAQLLDPTVARAISYIEENLLTLEGIDEICRELYISRSHLHHLFIAQMGVSPKKYIVQKRLEMAHRELTLGARATEIFVSCGFSDYSSFFRAYKKHFSYSPADTPKTDCVRITFSDFLKGYKS